MAAKKILREIAEVDGMITNQLIAKLYEVVNFASFLRVSCTRYLAQRRERGAELSLVAGRARAGDQPR